MRRREPEPKSFLSHLPFLHGASAAELDRLAAGIARVRLKRGALLFGEGDPPTGFYAVVHGRIGLYRGERMTDVVGAGHTFGEAVMFLGRAARVSARALADTLVLAIAKQTVLAEMDANPAFARRMVLALSAKLEAAMRELDTYALASGGRRFAAWLLRSADEASAVTLPAPKRAIAARLNLSAEHLSRVMRELSLEGLIEVRGRKVSIPDRAKLRAWTHHADRA